MKATVILIMISPLETIRKSLVRASGRGGNRGYEQRPSKLQHY